MSLPRSLLLAALLGVLAAGPTLANAGESKSYKIPYRMTIPRHIVVRVKLNGKGPFNFILDTGAPALFVATRVGEKAGVRIDDRGWGTISRFDIEGGLTLRNVRGRIETPFQLEGMNGMGLAGLEIHGLIGYQLLARYRMEIDFTRDKMVWTELDYRPEVPLGMGQKGGSQGGLEVFGSLMKTLGGFLGRRSAPELTLRGFLGMTLTEGDESPVVAAVLEQGPAGAAGLKTGDVLTHVQGRTVTNVADVLRLARRVSSGTRVTLTVRRNGEVREIAFTAVEGI
ncbi:MAG: PDZ domain-containing protein [Gemmataceae bacterium]